MDDQDPTNSKKKQVIKQQHHLCDDLIIQEILTRLPIKFILRFESVSKHWHSTLTSSEFANAHLIKSPFFHPSAPVNTLFIKSLTNYYLFSYDEDQAFGNLEDNLVKLDVDFGLDKNEHLLLTGCCNGLICLTISSSIYFILWNPATRKMHKYEPFVAHGYLKPLVFENYPYIAHGFGYASSVDDYKYVQILTLHWGNETGFFYIVHIFSLKKNQWTKIDFDYDVILDYDSGVLVNEKLYWLGQSRSATMAELIVSFDLAVETFHIFEFGFHYLEILGVMGECLTMCHSNTIHSIQNDVRVMHILKSDTIVKSSICLPKRLSLDSDSQIIGYTKTGKIFVTGPLIDDEGQSGYCSRILQLADTSMKPMRCTTLLSFNEVINVARYVPSLVSPYPILKSA